MKRVKQIRDDVIVMAPEASIRRLAKFCEVEGWATLPVPLLIEELGWKGVVSVSYPRGMY